MTVQSKQTDGLHVVGSLLRAYDASGTYKTGQKVGQPYTRFLVDVLCGFRVVTVSFAKAEDRAVYVNGGEQGAHIAMPVIAEAYKDRVQLRGYVPKG